MILASQQPGYFPDISFFIKMLKADFFILADDLLYSTRSNLSRTRIKTATGVQWLTVPVLTKGKSGQCVNRVEIDRLHEWQRNHWFTLFVNYKTTPYFEQYEDFFIEIFNQQWQFLAKLNIHSILYLKKELCIQTKVHLLSEFSTRSQRTKKVIDLLNQLGCDTYLVNRFEHSLIDETVINQAGFTLRKLDFQHPVYHQRFGNFVEGLSIIDLLMNEGPEAIELLNLTSL